MPDIRPRPQVPVQPHQDITPVPAEPKPGISASNMLSRTIFGGFWGLVSTATAWTSTKAFMTGALSQGIEFLVLAVLTGLYFQYLVRGGRFRIIAW